MASAILDHMGTMEDKLLEDAWATLTMQIKPWLDIKNEDVKSKLQSLAARKQSATQQLSSAESHGHGEIAAALLEAVEPVKSLIGGKGELCEKLMV